MNQPPKPLTYIAILLALSTSLAAPPAIAINAGKTATATAARAADLYQKAEFSKAAELYHTAFQADPQPDYLFAAARAEHMAGELEKAVDDYDKFLALPKANPARVQKANTYVAEARAKLLDRRVDEADAMAKKDPKIAIQLYQTLIDCTPQRVDLHFKAALAAQAAGEWATARQHLDAYLAAAPADAAFVGEARARREAVAAKLAAPAQPVQAGTGAKVDPGQKIEPAGPAIQASTPASPPRAPWLVVAGGAAMAVAGAAVGAWAYADAAQYAKDTTPGADGKVRTLAYDEASSQATNLRTREAWAWGLGGAGVATIAAGWWWAMRPSGAAPVTFVPSESGWALAGRF